MQQHGFLINALDIEPGEELIRSHVAARVNGYIGGYEMGIACPPDWVGSFHYGVDEELGEQKTFVPGTVANHESQFFLPHLQGFSILIDTMAVTETQARWLGRVPHQLIVA